MPTLEVEPNVSLAYLDSGVPDPSNEDYITVFALHGIVFYTPFFRRAIDVANKYNIRFVAITRRDYSGSSLMSDVDVKTTIEGPTEKRLEALKKRGLETLVFIDEFIKMNKIPSISLNGGGFSLLGWSLGNVQGMTTLAFANDFPELVGRLSSYFRSYILYETVLFFPYPKGFWHPLFDESKSKEEREPFLFDWISSHFIHPSEAIASSNFELANHKTPDASRPSVYAQLTAEERATMLDLNPLTRADLPYSRLDQAVNEYILKRAFTQQDNQNLIAWPNVPVKSLYGDQTCPLFIFGQWELEKWRKIHEADAKENRRWVRNLESTCIPGKNHFFHYNEPDRFVEAVRRLML